MRFLFWLLPSFVAAQGYDIVLQSGRVMDPESGFDAIRSVGIIGNRIAAVSPNPLQGKIEVDATHLVNVHKLFVAGGLVADHLFAGQRSRPGRRGAINLYPGISRIH